MSSMSGEKERVIGRDRKRLPGRALAVRLGEAISGEFVDGGCMNSEGTP